MGPPPGTKPAPTSHCDKMAFSRLAKRISLCERELASDAGSAPANRGDGHNWSAAQPRQHVGKRLQTCRAGRHSMVWSSGFARKSQCVRKKPSTALSKTTTFTCSSVSILDIIFIQVGKGSSGRRCSAAGGQK